MNILIFGADGFLGNQITKIVSDYDVLDLPNFDLIKLYDFKKINEFLNSNNKTYDLAINCCGINGAKIASEKRDHFYLINGFSSLIFEFISIKMKIKNFIHISSETVLGEGIDLVESSPISPSNEYAKSKSIFEDYMTSSSYFNSIKSIIFRLPILVGSNVPVKSAFDYITSDILNDYDCKILGDGSHIRQFLHVRSAAQMIVKIINEINNFSTGVNTLHAKSFRLSMNDIVLKVAKKNNKQPKIKYHKPNRQSEVKSLAMKESSFFQDFILEDIF